MRGHFPSPPHWKSLLLQHDNYTIDHLSVFKIEISVGFDFIQAANNIFLFATIIQVQITNSFQFIFTQATIYRRPDAINYIVVFHLKTTTPTFLKHIHMIPFIKYKNRDIVPDKWQLMSRFKPRHRFRCLPLIQFALHYLFDMGRKL